MSNTAADSIDIDALLEEVEEAVKVARTQRTGDLRETHANAFAPFPTSAPVVTTVPPPEAVPFESENSREEQLVIKFERPDPPFRPKAIINSLQFEQQTESASMEIVNGSENAEATVSIPAALPPDKHPHQHRPLVMTVAASMKETELEPEPKLEHALDRQLKEEREKAENEVMLQLQQATERQTEAVGCEDKEYLEVLDYLEQFSDDEKEELEQEENSTDKLPTYFSISSQLPIDELLQKAVESTAEELASTAVLEGVRCAGELAKMQTFYGDAKIDERGSVEDDEVQEIFQSPPSCTALQQERPATPIQKIDRPKSDVDSEVEGILESTPPKMRKSPLPRPETPTKGLIEEEERQNEEIKQMDHEVEEILESNEAEQSDAISSLPRPSTPIAKTLQTAESPSSLDTPSPRTSEIEPESMNAETIAAPESEQMHLNIDGEEEEEEEGLTTAIEVANSPTIEVCEDGQDTGEGSEESGSVRRFDAIAIVHDLSDTSSLPHRLTESELQLGKQCPYWIPDADSPVCMLCSTKFTLLNRRHHCRACGRVLCAACCKHRAALEYMKDDPKKDKARVCTPCFAMLARIEEYERELSERRANAEDGGGEVVGGTTPRVSKGVLKSRVASMEGTESGEGSAAVAGGGTEAGTTSLVAETNERDKERKRSVVFRDGVKPGTSTEGVDENGEKSTTLKPKKKQRKRLSVARRIAELKIEEELLCLLPETDTKPYYVENSDGRIVSETGERLTELLGNGTQLTVLIKRNLFALVKFCQVGEERVLSVCSRGFVFVGLDEVLFAWRIDTAAPVEVPLSVLHRISAFFDSCSDSCVSDSTGVRRSLSRLSSLHSVPHSLPPLSNHILFFRSSSPILSSLPLPPSDVPFKVALFLQDDELPWAMACPTRILSRLAYQYQDFDTPVVNYPGRDALFSADTNMSILKVFTDFRSWSYRLKHVPGTSISMQQSSTYIRIPRSAANEIKEIVSWNRTLLAWWSDAETDADSRLVCCENDGVYSTKLFKKNESSSLPASTTASFVILDGSLKGAKIKMSIVEDGLACRLSADCLLLAVEALEAQNDFVLEEKEASLRIVWVDEAESNRPPHAPQSSIDGKYLGLNWQYGLSLERAINSGISLPSSSAHAVRLSHVYNLREGRFPPEDEAKIFALVEILANEAAGLLDPFVLSLLGIDIRCISIRFSVNPEVVGYEVGQWTGLEEEWMQYKVAMDQLLPTLYNILDFVPCGFEVELCLSLVSLKSLPLPSTNDSTQH